MRRPKSGKRGGKTASSSVCPQLLLGLPGPACRQVLSQLLVHDRRNLRLACKAATAVVDSCAARLRLPHSALRQADVQQLQQRVPSATQLMVLEDAGDQRSKQSVTSKQPQWSAPWPTITSLDLSRLSRARPAARLLACLPGVKQLRLDAAKPNKWAPLLKAVCQKLPRLEALTTASSACHLRDEQLVAMAALTALTSLEARFSDDVTQAGWDAIASMQALRSLNAIHKMSKEGGMLELAHATQLTALRWLTYEPLGCATASGDEGDEEYVPVALHPPTSLARLSLTCTSQELTALPAFPHLTSLELQAHSVEYGQDASRTELAWLATQCPSLARLELRDGWHLGLADEACRTTPLAALTELVVEYQPDCSQSGVELAHVCPQLRALTFEHLASESQCGIESEVHCPYVGLDHLTRLDVGECRWPHCLRACDLEVLAALPALASLRMCAAPELLQGLHTLQRLRALELIWHVDWFASERSARELEWMRLMVNIGFAPPNLASATFVLGVMEVECEDGEWRHSMEFQRTLGVCMGALKRAPALEEFSFSSLYSNPWWHLTVHRLQLLGALRRIRRISLNTTYERDGVQVTGGDAEPEQQQILQGLIAQGIQVEIVAE